MPDLDHLAPPFRGRLQRLLDDPEARRLGLYVVSAFRPVDLQARLYDAKVAAVRAAHPSWSAGAVANEAGRWVAPPGRSNHGPKVDAHLHEPGPYGRAVDLGVPGVQAAAGRWPDSTKAAVDRVAARYGLASPMAWEDWHFEPVDGYPDPDPAPHVEPAALPASFAAIAASSTGDGYGIVGGDGGMFTFGDFPYRGSVPELVANHVLDRLNSPIVAADRTVAGDGYWLAAADGGVFAFAAEFHGSAAGSPLNQPIVGMAAGSRGGYWLAAADGGVFAFGEVFHGSAGGGPLNSPIVDIASPPGRDGYWLAAADGGIFTFGDLGFFGSMGGQHLNQPAVGMVATPTGGGYWIVAADGGIFAFGDATPLADPLPAITLNRPIMAAAGHPSGRGLFLVAGDGGVFTVGEAAYLGRPVAA